MKILKYSLGVFEANCYLVYDEKSKKAVLADPAIYDEKIMDYITSKQLSLEYILLTRGHFDHILGANMFRKKTGAKIAAHELEAEYLETPSKNMTTETKVYADILFKDGDIITFGDISLKVVHTPGHTKGSCCFVCDNESEKIILSGDTLFKNSIGRWDLYGGNYGDLMKSLQKLKNISADKNYNVYSGHGENTATDLEKIENLYFK